MLTFEERQDYYKTCRLILKDYPYWRLYKIQLENGKWESIRNQIYSVSQLRAILIEKAPINVYSSCSKWLNPLKIEHPSYVYADRLFIGNDVFIDQDDHCIEDHNQILSWFESKPRYKLIRTVDSGYGFHFYYQDTEQIIEPNPLKRIESIQYERDILVMQAILAGLNIDFKMTNDLFRISRVIGTLNDGQVPCTLIYDPRWGSSSERQYADEREQTIAEYRGTARTGPRACPPHQGFQYWYWRFIDIQVRGIKDRYCVFIKKDKKLLNLDKFIKKLKSLQAIYNLPEFYVYGTYNTYEAICPKAVPARRLLKILKQIKSKNYNVFRKYKHYWLRVSPIKDMKSFNIIYPSPRLIAILPGMPYKDTELLSAPHCHYLKIKPKGLFIGKDRNIIKTAFIKFPANNDGPR